MAGSISVTEGAGAAFGFLRRSWLRAAGALSLTGLLGAAASIAFLDHRFARAGLLALGYLLAAVMAQGALFRIVHVERQHAKRQPDDRVWSPGFGGFQWGGVEWRLLGAAVLRGLLFGLLAALTLTVLAAVYVGLAAAEAGPNLPVADPAHWRRTLDPFGWTVMSGLGLVGAGGLCWIGLRLYLAYPASVARGRVQVLSTWILTKGHAWRIGGGVVLVLLPVAGVMLAARIGQGMGATNGWGDSRLAAGVYRLVACLGQTFLMLPLGVGLMSYLYDRLDREDAGVSR